MKAIGIGCYWFANKKYRSGEFEGFSFEEYIRQLHSALERVDNVSNVEIDLDENFLSGPLLTFSDRDENFLPMFSAGSVSFDIFMPARLQEKYAFELAVGNGIENFHVDVRYLYDTPVAFISFDLPAEPKDWRDLSPSFAVAFIREHLKAKLSHDPNIELGFLGPSPLHADIFLKHTDRPLTEPHAEDISADPDSYRTFLFHVPKDDQNLLQTFEDLYENVLATFYRVALFRSELIRLRDAIIETTQSLFQSNRAKGLVGTIREYSKIGRVIDSAFELVLEERLCRVYMTEFVEERRTQSLQEKNIFYPMVMREVNDITQTPLEDVKEILRMVEERRQQYFGNFSTMIAGIAGGLIGAIIGAAMTFGLGLYTTHEHPDAKSPSVQTIPTKPVYQQHPQRKK
ncbi:MAG: hypothetical protein ACTHPD_00420 [Rhizomicrobium sp.]